MAEAVLIMFVSVCWQVNGKGTFVVFYASDFLLFSEFSDSCHMLAAKNVPCGLQRVDSWELLVAAGSRLFQVQSHSRATRRRLWGSLVVFPAGRAWLLAKCTRAKAYY